MRNSLEQVAVTIPEGPFKPLFKQAQSKPVEVVIDQMSENVVMMPRSQYENIGGEVGEMLAHLRKIRDKAEKNGLTEDILYQILNEE